MALCVTMCVCICLNVRHPPIRRANVCEHVCVYVFQPCVCLYVCISAHFVVHWCFVQHCLCVCVCEKWIGELQFMCLCVCVERELAAPLICSAALQHVLPIPRSPSSSIGALFQGLSGSILPICISRRCKGLNTTPNLLAVGAASHQ